MAREDVTTLDTIRDMKKSDPFAPFQIVMTSGDRYTIEDPDALAIGSSQVFYYPAETGAGVQLQNGVVRQESDNVPDVGSIR